MLKPKRKIGAVWGAAIQALEPRVHLCADDCPDPVASLSAPPAAYTAQPAAGATPSPLSAIPSLNSDPGAPATLYLDFHGEASQYWGFQTVPATPAYDIDGDPTTFSSQELANIQEIWSRVSEAYSPFNVNVTTVDPGSWDLMGGGSQNHQFRVVIGGNGSWTGQTEGGIAYVGSYYSSNLPNTGYVFPVNLANGNPQYTADDAAHEAGHGFGLEHQSVYSGTTKTAEYNTGNGSSAPIMGNPLSAGIRATWWNGPSSLGYNSIQDDLSVLSGSSDAFGFRSLHVGQTAGTATALSISNNTISTSGIIESTSQSDYLSFTVAASGSDTFTVNPAQYGGMLHAKLELHNATDGVIATANSAGTLGQTITANLAAGSYYLVVKSYGQYGDIGQYTLSGTLAAATPSGPTLAIYGNSSVNERSTYTLNLSASDPGQTISAWAINWGDGSAVQTVTGNPSSVTHTFGTGPNAYSISATATDGTGTYSAGNTQSVSVLHVPPVLAIGGAASVNEQSSYTLNLSASDPGHSISAWSINWGDGSAVQTLSGNPSAVTHVFSTGPHTYTISATATDDVGTYAAGNTQSVGVVHVAPVLSISGATSANEGAAYTLNLSASDPGHALQGWLINWGDGTSPQSVAANAVAAYHTFVTGPHAYSISATLTDDAGTYGANNPVTVSVQHVPPVLGISGPGSVVGGSPYTLVLSATDPGHVLAGWTVNWGDGSAPQSAAGYATSISHMFPSGPHTYSVSATASDDVGAYSAPSSQDVSVLYMPPTLSIGGPESALSGSIYTLNLSASDPAHLIQSWSINWGDGQPAQNIVAASSAVTHVFSAPGQYSVAAAAMGALGTWTAGNTVSVAVNPPAVFSISGPSTEADGQPYRLALSATDPGHTLAGWRINWGDGSAIQAVDGGAADVTHLFPGGPQTYAITAAVMDDVGTYTVPDSQPITIIDQPPTIAASGLAAAIATAAYSLNLSAIEPAGQSAIAWLVNWGDGSTVDSLPSAAAAAHHVYNVAGNYTISASFKDVGGTWTANPVSVAVAAQPVTSLGTLASTARRTVAGKFTPLSSDLLYSFTLTAQQSVETIQLTNPKDFMTLKLLDGNRNPIVVRAKRRGTAFTMTLGPGTYYLDLSLAGKKGTLFTLIAANRAVKVHHVPTGKKH